MKRPRVAYCGARSTIGHRRGWGTSNPGGRSPYDARTTHVRTQARKREHTPRHSTTRVIMSASTAGAAAAAAPLSISLARSTRDDETAAVPRRWRDGR